MTSDTMFTWSRSHIHSHTLIHALMLTLTCTYTEMLTHSLSENKVNVHESLSIAQNELSEYS